MYVLEIIEKSANWGHILPGNFIFSWLKNANFWEPCKKNILMMKPELTYISKHFLCQIHNFLRGTWTLDGSIRKTKHGISFRHSLQGREGLLEVLHVVVAHHRWVSFKCFWKTLDLKKKKRFELTIFRNSLQSLIEYKSVFFLWPLSNDITQRTRYTMITPLLLTSERRRFDV